MKKVGMRIALAIMAAGIMMLSLSCDGPGSNQVNTNTNGQNNSVDSTIAKAPPPPTDPCLDADKLGAVQDSIDTEIDNDDALRLQKAQGKFSATVARDPKHNIKLTIKGYVIGANRHGEGTIRDLLKIVQKHMKKGCVQRVVFQSNLSTAGFEWVVCESPNKTCPDGSCVHENDTCPSIVEPSPTPRGNQNTNSNANTIRNPNMNTNSKTNSNTNATGGNRNN